MAQNGEGVKKSDNTLALPKVSVVVINYERCQLLRACLLSLERQEGVEFETIVVDNGSSDGSADLVKEFAKGSKFALHLIENRANRGFCAANNQAFRIARGEYLALLNNDAEAEPGWLASLVNELEDKPDFGMAASKILVYEDPRKIDKVGHLIYPDGQNRGRGTGEFDQGQYDRVEEVLWPDGCAALYRRSMIEEIGGFDEDLFAYGDDAELGLRARIAGWGCLYVPKAVVRHHRGATLGLLNSRRVELIERNRLLLAVKHFPASLLMLNGFYWTARLAAGFVAGILGRGEAGKFAGPADQARLARALVQGNLQALRLIPSTLRKRRALRPLRRLSEKQIRKLLFRYKIPLRTLSERAI